MGSKTRCAEPLGRAFALAFALLALVLNANAPIQAAMMAADADGAAILCVAHTEGQGRDHRTPADHHEACAVCSLCAGGGAMVFADAGAAPDAGAPRPFAHPLIGRAPTPCDHPRISPNARGPPILA